LKSQVLLHFQSLNFLKMLLLLVELNPDKLRQICKLVLFHQA
jgi:hypothetical protein